MNDLRKHIQRQQGPATDLEGLLSALEHLHNESTGLEAQAALIRIARGLADDLCTNLDVIRLPPCTPAEGGARAKLSARPRKPIRPHACAISCQQTGGVPLNKIVDENLNGDAPPSAGLSLSSGRDSAISYRRQDHPGRLRNAEVSKTGSGAFSGAETLIISVSL
jgi:hypothetical protein